MSTVEKEYLVILQNKFVVSGQWNDATAKVRGLFGVLSSDACPWPTDSYFSMAELASTPTEAARQVWSAHRSRLLPLIRWNGDHRIVTLMVMEEGRDLPYPVTVHFEGQIPDWIH